MNTMRAARTRQRMSEANEMQSKTPIILASAGILFLAACTDPYTGAPDRTRSGALAGAALGGSVAAATGSGSRLGRTLIGAGIGAAAGGVIGAQLDRQAQDLRRDLGDDRIDIRNTGQELVVTMPQEILFATDSATVRPDLRRDLRAMAGNLQSYPDSRIQIIGHTDSTGAASYNQNLSERRANSVAGVLIDAGVPSRRINSIGRGETQPVATNLTPEGRAQNRRVEIIIRPTEA